MPVLTDEQLSALLVATPTLVTESPPAVARATRTFSVIHLNSKRC